MITDLPVVACSTCANAFKHAGGDAAGWAIAVMLCCIVPLVSGVLFLMIRMARREKAHLDPQYMDDYVPTPQNS
ncbi:hypothetical protein N9Z02_00140 [Akkermansiaceae bacterium]|nr:hypothetical protein [Akkermansiaceae bacterium]